MMKAVIFSWVIYLEEIMSAILQGITEQYGWLYKFTLVCAPEALKAGMQKDGRVNVQASLERLDMYKLVDAVKVVTTNDIEAFNCREEMLKLREELHFILTTAV